MATFVQEAMNGTYKQGDETQEQGSRGGYTGIILVPNAVDVTPPYVEEVMPGSPAARPSDLRPDDLILYVDGELVPTIKIYRDIMRQVGPGTDVRFEVQRGSTLESVKLKIADHPRARAAK